MLRAIQGRLASLYDLELAVDVDDFVCDEATARSLGGDDVAQRGEALFVVPEPDGTRVALYVGAAPIEGEGWLADAERFRASCLATEGVSHFVYLAFRADHEEDVSELELELQAEVDKWALGVLAPFSELRDPKLLAGRGAGLVALRDRSRRLRQRLFAGARFLDPAGTERGDRYRAAVRFAARYARALETEAIERGDVAALVRELRRFYRLGTRQKIERAAR